ncbi:hypothetical protein EDL98_04100 [Ornithobacterium rhinotracheale]|uniref:hypothetical protein n=1 Tax=Ornithobacterium rhinotracheale TaxID=28251 RepID=UPI00129C649A|nr:hypothetical protein [Ornithobacterium rhinotracheale]MRJ07635.1 hypothetical protein [Ornithobacterium rhinotracheale]MRJ10261.1 hypothetical protein [Ornithobacterium rhinotracheale]UOH78233.1 hypothetical protein MT996_01880 [Ornithobacterium rhinotracheale]
MNAKIRFLSIFLFGFLSLHAQKSTPVERLVEYPIYPGCENYAGNRKMLVQCFGEKFNNDLMKSTDLKFPKDKVGKDVDALYARVNFWVKRTGVIGNVEAKYGDTIIFDQVVRAVLKVSNDLQKNGKYIRPGKTQSGRAADFRFTQDFKIIRPKDESREKKNKPTCEYRVSDPVTYNRTKKIANFKSCPETNDRVADYICLQKTFKLALLPFEKIPSDIGKGQSVKTAFTINIDAQGKFKIYSHSPIQGRAEIATQQVQKAIDSLNAIPNNVRAAIISNGSKHEMIFNTHFFAVKPLNNFAICETPLPKEEQKAKTLNRVAYMAIMGGCQKNVLNKKLAVECFSDEMDKAIAPFKKFKFANNNVPSVKARVSFVINKKGEITDVKAKFGNKEFKTQAEEIIKKGAKALKDKGVKIYPASQIDLKPVDLYFIHDVAVENENYEEKK